VTSAEPAVLTLADLDYELPPELVAQHPVEPRDASRLLVWRRGTGRDAAPEDRVFRDLPQLLRAGDVLVRNDTRVFPARTFFRRATGGRIEALFLRPAPVGGPAGRAGADDKWEALLRGRPRRGEILMSEALGGDWPLACIEPLGDGRWTVASPAGSDVFTLLERAGVTPLPPYIHEALADSERYQTTYARVTGSAAAPTAGLHFTPAVDAALLAAGVSIETVTLHVGLGTFKPLQEDSLEADELHAEVYELGAGVWERVAAAHGEGRRVIAVGTTSMRVLEHVAAATAADPAAGPPLRGETRLFIRPGYEFRLVDGLVTNFHLPRTSLLALVMAYCGVEETRRLYAHAVRERYRFYSFGDAMVAL
jgi:S-adenosylmethionine:tRNA ribosyltransferase-isomerase